MSERASTGTGPRGYFAIGVEHIKTEHNIGTLWRSAAIMGASFIFTVGRRYSEQCADTAKAWRSIPLFHFADLSALRAGLPFSAPLVGIELDQRATPLADYRHPERAVYLLGAEDHGLSKDAMAACHSLIVLPGRFSMNVSVAGSIVLYDRITKAAARAEVAA